ncbi:uncharacterized protein LOC122501689 [Leptopilina heterotoma]|uniref:uncharacterized protein LOC122501689 n=1 Tax=Leptopilina heterotoma TaxID=63436 RepID=UPI001CA8B0C8|nr:uncharacterized protein LOC122501689 [Leptopilina heterotoma]
MIAPARNCGCEDKSEFKIPKNITNSCHQLIPSDDSIQDSEKCVCPKKSEAGYQKLKGTCDIYCEGNKKPGNDCTNEDVIEEEKKSKVFSEIVEKGLPYKETEIIINDNRMIIRVQKDPKAKKEEWDPPCDCDEENKPIKKPRNDITFRKVDLNPCRTITVYPQPDSEDVDKSKNELENEVKIKKEKNPDPLKIERQRREEMRKSIDLEENPNIFLLRIKKRCGSEEGKYNVDLEFRTPRPWLTRPIVEKPPRPAPTDLKVSDSKLDSKLDNKESKKDKKTQKTKTKTKTKTKKGNVSRHQIIPARRSCVKTQAQISEIEIVYVNYNKIAS